MKKAIWILLCAAVVMIGYGTLSAQVQFRGEEPYSIKAHPDELVQGVACNTCHQTGWAPELPAYGPRVHEMQQKGIDIQEEQEHIHANFGFTSCVVCHTNTHNAETATESLTGGSIEALASSCVNCHSEGGVGGYYGNWDSRELRPHTFTRGQ
ncbi:hypothetical protein [Desulfurispira natronophila]|uniref:Cytochrome c553 n=1 Tax=Desulfurispira natronophila TaxID=682562 RepID=A0A7W7Y3L3_9BACT|nr:hypothetical protein [Desulfurispira natronophila]MBB5021309.1 cytochrome c553 [Desulfurispira natronophila]